MNRLAGGFLVAAGNLGALSVAVFVLGACSRSAPLKMTMPVAPTCEPPGAAFDAARPLHLTLDSTALSGSDHPDQLTAARVGDGGVVVAVGNSVWDNQIGQSGDLTLFPLSAAGSLALQWTPYFLLLSAAMTVADLNGDGTAVLVGSSRRGEVMGIREDQKYVFDVQVTMGGPDFDALVTGDLDGHERRDIAVLPYAAMSAPCKHRDLISM